MDGMRNMTKKKYYGHPDFYKLVDELKELHSRKNNQYATQENPLANFIRCSEAVEKLLNPKIKNKALAYLLILKSKQDDAIIEMVAEGKEDTPDEIEDKLKDSACYDLLGVIIKREGDKTAKHQTKTS